MPLTAAFHNLLQVHLSSKEGQTPATAVLLNNLLGVWAVATYILLTVRAAVNYILLVVMRPETTHLYLAVVNIPLRICVFTRRPHCLRGCPKRHATTLLVLLLGS